MTVLEVSAVGGTATMPTVCHNQVHVPMNAELVTPYLTKWKAVMARIDSDSHMVIVPPRSVEQGHYHHRRLRPDNKGEGSASLLPKGK